MERPEATEEAIDLPTETLEGATNRVDTGTTHARAAEVIRQVGWIIVVKPAIRDKRYRQGV